MHGVNFAHVASFVEAIFLVLLKNKKSICEHKMWYKNPLPNHVLDNTPLPHLFPWRGASYANEVS